MVAPQEIQFVFGELKAAEIGDVAEIRRDRHRWNRRPAGNQIRMVRAECGGDIGADVGDHLGARRIEGADEHQRHEDK
ncbi:hypothetical protein L0337_02205 [candidate division KSB1 bacterium]|nr:hypothetical protein [candidate division KSB1 bacterium]